LWSSLPFPQRFEIGFFHLNGEPSADARSYADTQCH
jgi:hypothetical protein